MIMTINEYKNKVKNYNSNGNLNLLLSKYNGRFVNISKQGDSFHLTWIYDTLKYVFIIRLLDLGLNFKLSDVSDKVEEYLINERDGKLNDLLM